MKDKGGRKTVTQDSVHEVTTFLHNYQTFFNIINTNIKYNI